jgi:hypothetical protein
MTDFTIRTTRIYVAVLDTCETLQQIHPNIYIHLQPTYIRHSGIPRKKMKNSAVFLRLIPRLKREIPRPKSEILRPKSEIPLEKIICF